MSQKTISSTIDLQNSPLVLSKNNSKSEIEYFIAGSHNEYRKAQKTKKSSVRFSSGENSPHVSFSREISSNNTETSRSSYSQSVPPILRRQALSRLSWPDTTLLERAKSIEEPSGLLEVSIPQRKDPAIRVVRRASDARYTSRYREPLCRWNSSGDYGERGEGLGWGACRIEALEEREGSLGCLTPVPGKVSPRGNESPLRRNDSKDLEFRFPLLAIAEANEEE